MSLQVAKFQYYYTTLSLSRDMGFLSSVVAQDLASAVEIALIEQRSCLNECVAHNTNGLATKVCATASFIYRPDFSVPMSRLLEVFYALGDQVFARFGGASTLYKGYKKAEVKLACTFLYRGADERARETVERSTRDVRFSHALANFVKACLNIPRFLVSTQDLELIEAVVTELEGLNTPGTTPNFPVSYS